MSKSLWRLSAVVLGVMTVFALWALVEPSVAMAAAEHGANAAGHGAKEAGPTFGNSKGVAIVFWIFALCTIGGSIFVITRRNMVTAVMGMVGTFFAIAGLYLMLYASFLAVMQVLVYAGAIMVLFVFVIMILNRPEAEPWAVQGLLGKAAAAIGLLYLFKRIAGIVWEVKDTQTLEIARENLNVEVVLNHADPQLLADLGVNSIAHLPFEKICDSAYAICRTYEFGSVHGVGHTLFTRYLLPFEAVSIVLLVAVVGAIAIARPDKTTPDPKNTNEEEA